MCCREIHPRGKQQARGGIREKQQVAEGVEENRQALGRRELLKVSWKMGTKGLGRALAWPLAPGGAPWRESCCSLRDLKKQVAA